MRTNKIVYLLMHTLLFAAALAFLELYLFFVLAALAGLVPRKRKNFGYYFLASLLAMAAVLLLKMPEPDLSKRLTALMGTSPVPFWAVVGLISCLTLSITARAINSISLPGRRKDKARAGFSR